MRSKGLAVCAGFLGAMASVLGKLGMSGKEVAAFCFRVTILLSKLSDSDVEFALSEEEQFMTSVATTIIRGLLLLMTLVCNAVMWTIFVESMQGLSSGEAVVLNTGTNIIVSALFGTLLFGETLGVMWWVGASFIVAGMAILQSPKKTDIKLQNQLKQRKKFLEKLQ